MVDAISSYAASMYYSIGTMSNNQYQTILKMLKELGISSSGDFETDKLALQKAIQEKTSALEQQEKVVDNAKGYEFLLNSLSLTKSSDIETDKMNVQEKISQLLQDENLSETKRAYYEDILKNLDRYFPAEKTIQQSYMDMLGASNLADVNKLLLIKQYI